LSFDRIAFMDTVHGMENFNWEVLVFGWSLTLHATTNPFLKNRFKTTPTEAHIHIC